MEYLDFQKWLEEKKGLQKKSARDVVSRLKRALMCISLSKGSEKEDCLFQLQKHEEFKKFSGSVKSQVKRAVGLYLDFLKIS